VGTIKQKHREQAHSYKKSAQGFRFSPLKAER
jgi:hypothetical protein